MSPESPGTSLKIDEVARITGIPVDTIRYYQREGLLPPAERQGRWTVYTAAHLRALERIKDLQAKHFSIRAIKLLAADGRLGLLEELFPDDHVGDGSDGGWPADVDPSLVDDLRTVGLIGEPVAAGRSSAEEVAALRSAQRLIDAGLPRNLVLLLVELYVKKLHEWEAEVTGAVAGKYRTIPIEPLAEFASSDHSVLTSIVPLVEDVFRYALACSMQRIVQESLERLTEEEG